MELCVANQLKVKLIHTVCTLLYDSTNFHRISNLILISSLFDFRYHFPVWLTYLMTKLPLLSSRERSVSNILSNSTRNVRKYLLRGVTSPVAPPTATPPPPSTALAAVVEEALPNLDVWLFEELNLLPVGAESAPLAVAPKGEGSLMMSPSTSRAPLDEERIETTCRAILTT